MAIDDPTVAAVPGSVYGLDDASLAWPPPAWAGLVGAAPSLDVATPDANAGVAIPVPATPTPPTPPVQLPPVKSTMGPKGLEQPGAPVQDETPAIATEVSASAPEQTSALPGVPALASVPTLTAPPAPTDAAAPSGPPGAPDVPDWQRAMFGVPSSPEQLAANASQEQDARHQQYLDAVDQAGGAPPRIEGTDGEELDRDAKVLAANPYELTRRDQEDERAAAAQARADKLRASAEDEKAQAQNLANVTAARQQAAAARAQAEVDAKKIAAVDPTRWMNKSTYNSVSGMIAAALGGLAQMQNGGRNLGLEALNKAIDRDIDAQQNEQQQQRANISLRQSNTAANLADAEAGFVDKERFRVGVYQRALDDIQTKMQDFAPRSSAVRALAHQYQQIAAAQQVSYDKIEQADFNNRIKAGETAATIAEKMANARKSDAETAKIYGKIGGGTGAGGATNPNYTVATGFFDPFTNEPIFGKRAIGGKGEDAKERQTVGAQILTYAHVQDYWAKLADLARQGADAKTAGESVYKGWMSTHGAEYDAARHALVVYLTKELGDKLTQGQLDAQAHRIPERKGLFESRDPKQQIADAQMDADRDFARDMAEVGVNAEPIVRHAQTSRARPEPSPDDAITSAQSALTTAKTDVDRRDATEALTIAKGRKKQEIEDTARGQEAESSIQALRPGAIKPHDDTDLPSDLATEVEAHNSFVKDYDAKLRAYQALAAPKATKNVGDNQKADGDFAKKKAKLAGEVLRARNQIDQAERDASEQLGRTLSHPNFGGMPIEKVQRIAQHLGVDPNQVGATPLVDVKTAGPESYAANQQRRIDEQTAHGSLAARISSMTPQQRLRLYRWFMGAK